MKPCMIISPESVPTDELDKPAINRPTPNSTAESGLTMLLKWLKATSRSSTKMPFL
jgi:hypothetical protein